MTTSMDQLVLKSLALSNERPKESVLIIPFSEKSMIQPLRESARVNEIPQGIFKNNFSLPSVLPSSFNIQSVTTLGNIIKKDEVVVDVEPVSIHPFLNCNTLKINSNETSKMLTTLEDLVDKKIDYKDILLKNGISQSAPLKFSINFNMLMDINNPTPNPVTQVTNSKLEISQHWTLMDIVTKNPPNSWIQVFNESYKDLERISKYLQEREQEGVVVYPLKKDIFRALELTSLYNVKVVIIGQDPYPGTILSTGGPIANGLAFSSNDNRIPQSLANIYKVLKQTVPSFIVPHHADLSPWAKQGVLLLNSCLTLDEGNSASHKGLWSEFITRLLHHIDINNPNCVYMLWGNHAQDFSRYTKSKNILMTSHPSNQAFRLGFCNCNHFNEANEILKKNNKIPIDWNLTK